MSIGYSKKSLTATNGSEEKGPTTASKMFMQWWGEYKLSSFYHRSTFGLAGQIHFQKPTTA